MKNKRLLFVLLILALTTVALSACGLLPAIPGMPGGTTAASTTVTTAPATTAAPGTTAPPVTTAPEKLEADLTFESKTYTYDSTAKTIAVEGLPEGALVEYYIGDATEAVDAVAVTNAGTYDIVAKITLPDTYKPCADMTATLTINKAQYVLEGIDLPHRKFVYDGTPKALTYTGTLPEGVSLGAYAYLKGTAYKPVSADQVIEADVYQVSATFVLSAELAANYEPPHRLQATLTIVERTAYDLDGVTVLADGAAIAERTVHITYGAAIPAFTLSDLPAGLTKGAVEVYNGTELVTGKLPVGTYTVKIALINANQEEYLDPAPLEARLVVDKAPIADFDTTVAFNSLTVKFNGQPQTIAVTGLDGFAVTVLYYIDGATEGVETVSLTDTGVYRVVAKFTSTDPNYADPSDMEATLEISAKEVYDMTNVQISAGGTDVVNKTVEIVYGTTIPDFAVTGLPDGLTMGAVTVYKDDAPVTGKLSVGTYTVKIALINANPTTHNDVPDFEVTLIVKKAPLDMSGIGFVNKVVTYNGSAQTIAVTGTLPTGVTVLYYINGATEGVETVALIGAAESETVYTVVAKFTVADPNYETPADMTATLTINAKQIYNTADVVVSANGTAVVGDALSMSYGDALPTFSLSNLPDGLTMGAVTVYKDGNLVDATSLSVGTYTVKIAYVNSKSEYNDPEAITLTLTVSPKEEDLPDGVTILWDYDAQKTSDSDEGDYIIFENGRTYTVSLTKETQEALSAKGIILSYTGNMASKSGSYTAVVTLKSADGNVSYGFYECQWNLRPSGWAPPMGGEGL